MLLLNWNSKLEGSGDLGVDDLQIEANETRDDFQIWSTREFPTN